MEKQTNLPNQVAILEKDIDCMLQLVKLKKKLSNAPSGALKSKLLEELSSLLEGETVEQAPVRDLTSSASNQVVVERIPPELKHIAEMLLSYFPKSLDTAKDYYPVPTELARRIAGFLITVPNREQ